MKRWSLPVALAVCIFLKFILFDVIWSSDTTFQSFSQPESYLIKGAIALLLAFPTVFFRSRWYAGIVCFLLDILLVANLMYWRTYYIRRYRGTVIFLRVIWLISWVACMHRSDGATVCSLR